MPTLVLQPGALIFVTGVNGLIGSHIADQLLARGYNVRGAVRDVEKSAWLSDYFTGKHTAAHFELVSVPDMTIEGCYDAVVKDCAGFIHVASPLTGQDPQETIPQAISGGVNALKSSAKTPSIQRVVFTSSSIAATFPKPNTPFSINETSYNEDALQWGWNHPADQPADLKGLFIYAATKTATEKALWGWVRENKPGFVFNSVLPNANFGAVLVPEKQGFPSTIEWCHYVWTGENFDLMTKRIGPQWFIDPVDDALLHIGALIYSDVQNERLFGFAERFTWNDVLAVFRKIAPARAFPDDVEGLGRDMCEVPNQRAEEVLGWVKGSGWKGLEKSLREMVPAFEKVGGK
ncbi:dihydroflavonol-4-reductase [Polyplosphaeria fusca]|uniref:Dihydroflavonol-4-reductase n=1 Tax=Polyplosphaeria fusca TaxID=682080 RepID=A0A9P4QQC2_9PLEO|nr:dihydroflavonol-4-reductase [Polyplosphaeria fusca]